MQQNFKINALSLQQQIEDEITTATESQCADWKKKVDEIEKPPLPPRGTYRFRVSKLPSVTKSKDGRWEIVSVPLQAIEAEDVDMDGYKGEVASIYQTLTFMFDTQDEVAFNKTEYRFLTFLEKHVKCVEDGMTLAQAQNAAVGNEILADISWQEDKNNPGEMRARVSKTAPLD